MADYSLKVTLRNGRILDAIRVAGYRSARQFAMKSGLNENMLNSLIGFRVEAVGKDGRLSKIAQDVCDHLCALPEDLWTDEQLWARLPRNSWTFDLSQDQAQALAENRPLEECLDLTRAPRLLEKLSDRQRAVINAVLMQGKTLDEAAHEMGVTPERIRQIEHTALAKMRIGARRSDWLGG
jgi:RNA polymerase sigma factor (sigma-70 family)